MLTPTPPAARLVRLYRPQWSLGSADRLTVQQPAFFPGMAAVMCWPVHAMAGPGRAPPNPPSHPFSRPGPWPRSGRRADDQPPGREARVSRMKQRQVDGAIKTVIRQPQAVRQRWTASDRAAQPARPRQGQIAVCQARPYLRRLGQPVVDGWLQDRGTLVSAMLAQS